MLFLPKYGTMEVCAVAGAAASRSVASTTIVETGAEEGSGTRVRISIYLKRQMTKEACLILLLWRMACKRCARPLRRFGVRVSSAGRVPDSFGRQVYCRPATVPGIN